MTNFLLVPYTHQLSSAHILLKIGEYLREENHNIVVAGDGYDLDFAKRANH